MSWHQYEQAWLFLCAWRNQCHVQIFYCALRRSQRSQDRQGIAYRQPKRPNSNVPICWIFAGFVGFSCTASAPELRSQPEGSKQKQSPSKNCGASAFSAVAVTPVGHTPWEGPCARRPALEKQIKSGRLA